MKGLGRKIEKNDWNDGKTVAVVCVGTLLKLESQYRIGRDRLSLYLLIPVGSEQSIVEFLNDRYNSNFILSNFWNVDTEVLKLRFSECSCSKCARCEYENV